MAMYHVVDNDDLPLSILESCKNVTLLYSMRRSFDSQFVSRLGQNGRSDRPSNLKLRVRFENRREPYLVI